MGDAELSGPRWRALADDDECLPTAVDALSDLEVVAAGVDPGAIARDHLPLARLVALLVDERRRRWETVDRVLPFGPASSGAYVVGLTGGVAVGKSTTAAALARLLGVASDLTAVVVSTDGFLRPNDDLDASGLLDRKGFPETYDWEALLAFVEAVASGRPDVVAPVYDHRSYNVLRGAAIEVGQPDVVVLEGINVLQVGGVRMVSDQLDLSIYVDADEDVMRRWFTDRLVRLRALPIGEAPSFFAAFEGLSDSEFLAMGAAVWSGVNGPNLAQHIEPTRARAHVVMHKGADHAVDRVVLRRPG